MTVGSGVRMSGLAQSPVSDDHDDREREVEEEHRLGLPGRGLQPERADRPEDRVGEQDARSRRSGPGRPGSPVVGMRVMPDREAGPAQDRDERSEVAEGGDRAGVEAGPEPGPAGRCAPDRVVVAPAAGHRAGRRPRRRPGVRRSLGHCPFLEPTEAYRTDKSDIGIGHRRRGCAGWARPSRRVLDRAAGGLDGRNRCGEVDRGRAPHGAWRDRHRR